MNEEPFSETFSVRINDGPEQQLTVATGIYSLAAVAAPAILGCDDLPVTVEIWCPRLLRFGYGPYHYIIRENEYGQIVAVFAIPVPSPPPVTDGRTTVGVRE